MVDREHVAGTEAAPEKVDQESQGGPPEDSASEESYDDEKSPSQAGDVEGFDRRNFENREESQDIGNDQHEIGDRKAKNRSEVLCKAGLAGPVAADLRYRVLKEDIDAYDDYEDAGDHTQQLVVLVDLSLEHRVAEVSDHRHQRIGSGYTEPRHDPRAAAFAEGPLDAQNGHRSYRDRRGDADAESAQQNLDDFQIHALSCRFTRQSYYKKVKCGKI